jgi:NAD(P)-dependent dehydrogenase (short-subunit alcohol dehydrogenase family)
MANAVLITGASSGVGEAVVRYFSESRLNRVLPDHWWLATTTSTTAPIAARSES